MGRQRVLIEDWLPIQELGIESRRERAVAMDLPPIYALHVWWARRPLVACTAVILASLLPPWTSTLAELKPQQPELGSDSAYRHWVLRLCGVWGDPIAAKRQEDENRSLGVKSAVNPYGYKPAFKNRPTQADLELLHEVLLWTWGATQWGLDLLPDLNHWAGVLSDRVEARLAKFFPAHPGERITNYLFARAINCPRTGRAIPLVPNWWLRRERGAEVAARLVSERDGTLEFAIVTGAEAVVCGGADGTVARGQAISPWDGLVVDGEYIKEEARASRMTSVLYSVVTKRGAQRVYRTPTALDREAVTLAEESVLENLPKWLETQIVPTEEIPEGNDTRPLQYGMTSWRDLFSPRQLLVHGTFADEFRLLTAEVRAALPEDRSQAILGLIGLMQGKALNWNSILTSWNVGAQGTRSVFDRHDFSFKWTFSEFEGGSDLFHWILGSQLGRAYKGLVLLSMPSGGQLSRRHLAPVPAAVTRGNAANLSWVVDGSQALVCIDPPYYDNVMYGELSDFFGAWEQHTVGAIWPDLMPGGLADVKNEAVANPARFADTGRRKKKLAIADYEAKMQAIFGECHRVLRDNGVLTVMFTHKKAEAWNTLGMALMQAGFTIETSWPVNTEREASLHQARRNSAASTIMLVCRKRERVDGPHQYFEDLEADVRRVAREAVERFAAAGISGVDLLLSTYGPALSVISAQWPVYSSEADTAGKSRLLRPEEALEAAHEEVVRLQRHALIGRPVDLDPLTDFVLLAWSTFRAVEFPFDEARRLALALGGLDLDELAGARVLTKKAGMVELCEPRQRLRRRGDEKPGVRPDAETFSGPAIDAVHTLLYVADADGLADAKALVDRTGLANDNRFMACLQGLVNAIPRTKDKGNWVRPEAGLLDGLVTAYFPEIEIPEDWTGRLDLDGA